MAGHPGPDGTLPPMTLAGRSAPGGRVDDLTLQSGHWADQPGQLVLAVNPSSDIQIGLPLGARLTVTSAPGPPGADRGREGHLGHQLRERLGDARRDRPAAHPGDAPQRPDAVPLPQRRHGRGRPRGCRRGQRGAAVRRGDRRPVLPDRPGAGDVADRAVRAVPGRLRGDRPGDVGADRGQRGQRRGGVGIPPDRDPQEHRLHPGAGGGGLYGPGHGARAGRRAWAAWWSATCWP